MAVPESLVDAIAARVAELLAGGLDMSSSSSSWLDVDGAADYLACRTHRIYDLVSQGRLRHAKDGRRSLFRREWLDAYLEDGLK